ncbi:MAG: T9SS type A sorting domain-containing protein [Bacteroidota bacterium]
MKRYSLYLLLCFFCTISAHAQNIFVVTTSGHGPDINPGDGICATWIGVCTFRAAIEESNATVNVSNSQPDEIHFSPGPFANRINLSGPALVLPDIDDHVIIDGTTAEGGVYIDGTLAAQDDGIVLATGSRKSVIKGLTIGNFSESAILVEGGSDQVIIGNYLGTDQDGNDRGNGFAGIELERSSFSVEIGSSDDPNVIGFNEVGVYLSIYALFTQVENNYVGTNAEGDFLGNNGGIDVYGRSNIVSGNTVGFNQVTGITVDGELNRITANYVGVNEEGDDLGSGIIGIADYGSANEIGGVFNTDGNVIGNNDTGILLAGVAGRVENNYIGTNASGANIGNAGIGIKVNADRYVIGSPVAGNVIGFNEEGINIGWSRALLIRGNYIGVSKSGTPIGNFKAGLRMYDIDDSLIGGDFYGAVNTIGSNGTYGIHVSGSNTNFRVEGNYIGTNSEHQALGNALGGILMDGGFGDSVIGYGLGEVVDHTKMGKANYIFFNKGPAVGVIGLGSHPHTIRGNATGENDGIGIDLKLDGNTPNDEFDDDTGANTLLNSPDIGEVLFNSATGQLEFTFIHTADTMYAAYPLTLDFYIEDQSAFASQGVQHIASTSYINPQDLAVLTVDTTGLGVHLEDVMFTATATDSLGNTSEFGGAVGVSNLAALEPSLVLTEQMDTHELKPAFPNPFNPSTSFELLLREDGPVQIAVHDMLGRRVATLHDGMLEGARVHTFTFNAAGLASGSYLLRVQGDRFVETRQLQLVK